jgi:hypothetical protein
LPWGDADVVIDVKAARCNARGSKALLNTRGGVSGFIKWEEKIGLFRRITRGSMVWREKKSGWEGKSWNLDGSSNNKIISGEQKA